jgi:hypothetical protein
VRAASVVAASAQQAKTEPRMEKFMKRISCERKPAGEVKVKCQKRLKLNKGPDHLTDPEVEIPMSDIRTLKRDAERRTPDVEKGSI